MLTENKVSVIIPVYNVEDYIERCLHSLFGQTMDEIEFIFIDDASPDNSINIIKRILDKYPHRKERTKILRHSANQGVAATRTTGIQAATGEYIIHCDPDDYVECNMYELMWRRAKETNSDIVTCNYYVQYKGHRIKYSLKTETTPQKLLAKLYKSGYTPGYLVNQLVKKSLIREYNILPYIGGDYGEDMGCTARILYFGKSISHLNQALYYYIKRENSITSSPKDLVHWEMRKKVIDNIDRLLQNDKAYRRLLNFMKLYTKLEYRGAFYGNEETWFKIYRESHNYILRMKNMPLKQKMFWFFMLQNYKIFDLGNLLYKKITGRIL